jgi:hypothetical protein
MPYAGGDRLPGEAASKIGHLAVVQSPWVRSLVEDFERSTITDTDTSQTPWAVYDPNRVQVLGRVWAVDGSFVAVQSQERPPREVAFVKTALITVNKTQIDAIDKDHPHPLHLKDVMTGSGLFHSTVFPLKNVKSSQGTNYNRIRHIVRDSMQADEDGAFYETLKWLTYRKWQQTPTNSPAFECPHCWVKIEGGLPPEADEAFCPHCGADVFLTDMIGFHLDMGEDNAPDSIASAYMLLMEHLMLFTPIRLCWAHHDKRLLTETLFLKDGPLTLRSQYSKLVPPIRALLQHAKEKDRPIHIVGQEKTGTFVDHLRSIVRFAPPQARGEQPTYAALSHEYVRREVYRTPDLSNPYGLRTNWGEKVYLKTDPGTYMVLNIPTGDYNRAQTFPTSSDLIGLDRILATIPTLISHKFEGALFPIELANGIASMSSYPSAKILERFLESH